MTEFDIMRLLGPESAIGSVVVVMLWRNLSAMREMMVSFNTRLTIIETKHEMTQIKDGLK